LLSECLISKVGILTLIQCRYTVIALLIIFKVGILT